MRISSLPPFYVGQKVVCVDDSNCDGDVRRNQIYVVDRLAKTACCGIWMITIRGVVDWAQGILCTKCGGRSVKPYRGALHMRADRFRPLQEQMLSKEERHRIYKDARALVETGRWCMCPAISQKWVGCYHGYDEGELMEWFPEFAAQKPAHEPGSYGAWFDRDDIQSRLAVLDKCIELTKPEVKESA